MSLTVWVAAVLNHLFPLNLPQGAQEVKWEIRNHPALPQEQAWALILKPADLKAQKGRVVMVRLPDQHRTVALVAAPSVGYLCFKLKEDVGQGEKLSPSKIHKTLHYQPLGYSSVAFVTSFNNQEDYVAACSLKTGAVLRKQDVLLPQLIQKGDRLQCVRKRGLVNVSVPCQAQQSGALGQKISVRLLGPVSMSSALGVVEDKTLVNLL